jgi:hypothetical protein
MSEVVVADHDVYHAEIFHFITQCNQAQGALKCRRVLLSSAQQERLAASRISGLDACRIAAEIKLAHHISPEALFLALVAGNVYDDESDEYFVWASQDAGDQLPASGGPVAVLSLYYQQESSTFMRDGARWWRSQRPEERRRIFSDSILNNLLSAVTSWLGHCECHPESRGCIMDWCETPTDLVAALRGGFVYCAEECAPRLAPQPAGAALLAMAARLTGNPFRVRALASTDYDVFLCHRSGDKALVRDINRRLLQRGIRTWLDEDQLLGGDRWQEVIQTQLASINSAAVFVGDVAPQRWQAVESDAIIGQFVERGCRLIPVMLPGSGKPELPLFLRDFMCIDFGIPEPDPLERLIWAITGERQAASPPA